jgi:cancer susceptibility candidate protein 1
LKAVPSKTESSEALQKPKKGIEGTPILITLRLPEDVWFCEEPLIARWDENDKSWRTDGFADKMFNEGTRQLTFRTCYFTTFALLQDSHANMPFQSWELRPRGANHCQLTIIAAVVEIEIQIKEGLVCLSQPINRTEVQHLIDVWMSVPDFIKAMRNAGVNVFPADDSFKYVKISEKNAAAEVRLYRQMALVASAMAFSWSHWNNDIENREQIVVQASEQLLDEPPIEEQWWLCLVTKKKCGKLTVTEFDEAFSDELADNEFYADMYHMAKSFVSSEGSDRIDRTTKNFVDAVSQLLTSTRLIVYT